MRCTGPWIVLSLSIRGFLHSMNTAHVSRGPNTSGPRSVIRALNATWVPRPVCGTATVSLLEPLILSHQSFFPDTITSLHRILVKIHQFEWTQTTNVTRNETGGIFAKAWMKETNSSYVYTKRKRQKPPTMEGIWWLTIDFDVSSRHWWDSTR